MNSLQQICTAIDHEMFCFAALADVNNDMIYSDLTGKFPVQSFSGMNYIFIAYIYTINAILINQMKGMNDDNVVAVFKEIYAELEGGNCKPKLHVLDNQCPKAVKKYIKSEKVAIQLLKPYNHRVNAAELAVKTPKCYMISCLATVDINCPLQL